MFVYLFFYLFDCLSFVHNRGLFFFVLLDSMADQRNEQTNKIRTKKQKPKKKKKKKRKPGGLRIRVLSFLRICMTYSFNDKTYKTGKIIFQNCCPMMSKKSVPRV